MLLLLSHVFKLLSPLPPINTANITITLFSFMLFLSLRLLLPYVADVIICVPYECLQTGPCNDISRNKLERYAAVH